MKMNKIVRASLLIAGLYCAGSYYFDRPQEIERDVAALQEMADRLPEPDAVIAEARKKGEVADQTVADARERLDHVRESVSSRIEAGTQRLAGTD